MSIIELHHIQLAMPPGEEETARAFYVGVLGFHELPKPDHLKKRGGIWLRSNLVEVHLGIEADFHPAKKAHPAFLVDDLSRIENL